MWLFSHDYIQLLVLGVCKSHLIKAVSFLNLLWLVLSSNLNIHLCRQCLRHITRSHQDSWFQLLGFLSEVDLNFRIALAIMTSGLAFANLWKSVVRPFGQFTNKNICSSRFISMQSSNSFFLLLLWSYYHPQIDFF